MPTQKRLVVLGLLFLIGCRPHRQVVVPEPGTQGPRHPVTITVTLRYVNGVLQEEVLDPADRDRMTSRAKAMNIKPDKPDPKHHPAHVPLVLSLYDEDTVVWTADSSVPFPFTIGVTQHHDKYGDEYPSNPFDWETAQTGDALNRYTVTGKIPSDQGKKQKIADQRDFKFTVYAKGISMDPDVICGSGPF